MLLAWLQLLLQLCFVYSDADSCASSSASSPSNQGEIRDYILAPHCQDNHFGPAILPESESGVNSTSAVVIGAAAYSESLPVGGLAEANAGGSGLHEICRQKYRFSNPS
jgi:hypothetical protein